MRIVIGLGLVVVAAVVASVLAFGGKGREETQSSDRPVATPRLQVTARGVESAPLMLQFDDDPPGTLRLEGQVVDIGDKAIANATVVIDANPPREARTEEDGTFAFDRLTPRSYRIAARTKDGNAGPIAVQLGQRTEPVILRVRESARIVVTVTTDAAVPVRGALVELRDLVSTTAITDEAGRVTLRGIGPGWHSIKASADRFASAFADIASTGDAGSESRVDLVLRAGVSVAGTVVDPSGAPIENARVLPEHVSQVDDHYDARFDGVVTDAKGRWRIPGLSRETTRIRAYHAAYAPGASTPLVLAEAGDRDGVTIILERGGRARGKVVDAAGAPVPGAEVRISADTVLGGRVRRVSADAAGEFAIAGLPRRMMYAVAATETATSKTTPIDLSKEAAPVVLRLEQGVDIAGVVVTREGETVPEARLVAERTRSDSQLEQIEDRLRGAVSAIADIDGRFRFTGLEAGSYLVRAIRPGSENHLLYARLGVPIETGATNAKIVVDDLSAISGRVAFASGKPVARFAVQLGTGPLKWFTGADGKFRVDDVPAGKQFIRISGPDLITHSMPDVEIERGTTDLGTITVQTGRAIAGIVVDRSGRAVAGATIAIGREIEGDGMSLVPYPDPDVLQAVSGSDGRFSVRGIGSGIYQIAAEHDTAGRSQMIAIPASTTDVDLTLTLLQPGVIQGFVRRFGKPAEAIIVLRGPNQSANSRITVRTGIDGSYRFDRVAPDRYMHGTIQPHAKRDDGSDGKLREVVVQPGATVNFDVDLTPTGVAMIVHIGSPGNAVKFGYGTVVILDSSTTLPPNLTLPKTFTEARALSSQISGFEIREGMIVTNQQVRFEKVPPGRHVACVAPLRGDPNDPSVMAELGQNVVDWPIYCKWMDVTAVPDPQHVTVEVQPLSPPK